MKRIVALVFVLSALSMAGPARAITFGVPDAGDHPNVGAVFLDFGDGLEQVCSGTLISATVFLTVAHCFDDLGSDRAWVSFASDVDPVPPIGTLLSGTWTTHPDYRLPQFDPADLAVIVLDEPVVGITPASLPTKGRFNRSASLRGKLFTAVGYGDQEPETGGGPPRFEYDGQRRRSVSRFSSVSGAWLRLSQNSALGNGGTCFGDSGGPNFVGAGDSEKPVIASLTNTGDNMCRSRNVTLRLDTSLARSFLDDFVSLP
jgi:hypothetical protein